MNTFEIETKSIGNDILSNIFGSGNNDVLMPKEPADKELEENASRVFKHETTGTVLDTALKTVKEEKATPKEEEVVPKIVTRNDNPEAKAILDNVSIELLKPQTEEEIVLTDDKQTAGRPKTDKNALASYIVKKIQADEYGLPDNIEFDATKQTLEDVVNKLPEETLHTILDSNWKQKESELRAQTPQEFFESLPESLQYAARAVAEGAGEEQLQDIYKALLRVEQVKNLDPKNEDHQPAIIQSYLQATGWKPEAIAETIEEWKEGNKLAKKASEFKPMLDDMQKEQVEAQVQAQTAQRERDDQLAQFYAQNVYRQLETNELGGVKIDKKLARQMADNMTSTAPSPWNGQPVNWLGYGLHKAQFIEPDYEAVILAAWALNDKKGFLEMMSQGGANKKADEVAKLIKLNQGLGKTGGEAVQVQEDKKPVKRITADPSKVLGRIKYA